MELQLILNTYTFREEFYTKFKRSLISHPVFFSSFYYLGEGSHVLVYDYVTNEHLSNVEVFRAANVHGIISSK